MKIRSNILAPLVMVFFVIGIAGTMLTNYWNTEKLKVPVKFEKGTFAGEYNPADIRGSYTLEDVNKAFQVPVADMAKAFGFGDAENQNQIKAKDIEETYGEMEQGELGTDSLRLFVALYSGRPHSPEETTLLTNQAVRILKEKAGLSEKQLEELNKIKIDISSLKPGESSPPAEHEESAGLEIKGKTTFQDLLDGGLSQKEIEGILGIPMGRSGDKVRDYLTDKNLEYKEYKTRLQEFADSK
jgi:hypothetical protein